MGGGGVENVSPLISVSSLLPPLVTESWCLVTHQVGLVVSDSDDSVLATNGWVFLDDNSTVCGDRRQCTISMSLWLLVVHFQLCRM